MMTDRRLASLRAALGFLQLRARAPELRLLHRWLGSWAGVGAIATGLHRQGWDLQLTQYGDEHLACDVLRDRPGALHRRWLGVGADGVAGGATRRVGGNRSTEV